ncbi:MAG: MltA domain-containing protein, partial [Aestuariivirga sp.]
MAGPMAIPAAPVLEPLNFSAIPGWAKDDHAAALAAFKRSCAEIAATGKGFERKVTFGGTREQWLALCAKVQKAKDGRRFFEENFQPFKVNDPARSEGLFTGYYEPAVLGSRTLSGIFHVPLYRKPANLVAFD